MNPETIVFGRYQLHEQIGAGGMGVVWRATDQLLHQTVALKHVSFAQPSVEQARLTRDRTLREARLAAQLRGHPHVVSVYDVLVDDSGIWLVMEYLPAHSLRELLRAHGRPDPARVARIGACIADALAAGHALGIEHRDVKPGNILITTEGTVKLTDFGISHLAGDPHLTHTGISGTPAYLAPEVAGKGESSPASDVFSLGSTLYAAIEGQPPFGTDDNILRLLNVVRTGIIRPPTQAGPLEPLLLRLLQLDPGARPDAATTRDMLAQLAIRLTDPSSVGTRGRKQLTPRQWWPLRRRSTLAVGALASVAGMTAAVLVGLIVVSGATEELPDTPAAHDADPCPLINVDALGGFGQAQLATPPLPESCQADITSPDGDQVHVQVVFYPPGKQASELGGAPRQIGDRTIVRKDRIPVSGTMGCQDWLMPTPDEPLISITTLTYSDDKSAGLCAVTDAVTTAAAGELERNGITYTRDRLLGYSLARSDACATLDGAILGRVPGLDPGDHHPGFANWSCFWDTADEDGSQVKLYFALGKHNPDDAQPTTIAGRKAFLYGESQNCDAYVEHRPATATSSAETFFLTVKAPVPDDEICTLASDLATAVATRLPGNFRTADPCALLNLDSLHRFGESQPVTGPWLESCQADIGTANGGKAELRVILEKFRPAADLGGTQDRVGDLVIVRNDRVSYWGRDDACRRDLVLTSDQPRIVIYVLTKSDKPIDLCAIAEAATIGAIEALGRNGGITYAPDRISRYSHATSDACTTLDATALDKVPNLNQNKQSPGFANWTCYWGTTDDGGTRGTLYLRSEDPEVLSSFYEKDLEHILLGTKDAFIDRRELGLCKIFVVRRSTDTALEILELQTRGALPNEELCGQVTQLATAAEDKLPG